MRSISFLSISIDAFVNIVMIFRHSVRTGFRKQMGASFSIVP